ncbi:MAG TPA: type II secretion system F family protein, partial [Candidatus Limnocylindria bacterium]|nr:type II secretion system F family protein [Candidatus Limnocylindria bacterium]
KLKQVGQYFILRFPGIGGLAKNIELTRLGFVMGNLLKAGLPIVKATEMLAAVTPFYEYKKLYSSIAKNLDEGNSLRKTFEVYPNSRKLIPTPIQQIIIVGEESGNLSESLLKIGQVFEEKTDLATKNLTVVLEPILLVIVWLAVVGVAIAVILPLYSLIGGLNKH